MFTIVFCFPIFTGGEEGCGWIAGTGNFMKLVLLEFVWTVQWLETDIGCARQVFVRKVIELHDKYLAYVNDCFQNHTLFHKVCIREASSFVMIGLICSSASKCSLYYCRHSRRLLRSSATRVLLEAQVQNCLLLFVITFLRKVEARNWVMKPLKKHLKRSFLLLMSYFV
jgi:hypothetical protein